MQDVMTQLNQLLSMLLSMVMRQLGQQRPSNGDSGSGSPAPIGGSTPPPAALPLPRQNSDARSTGGSGAGTPAVISAARSSLPTSTASGPAVTAAPTAVATATASAGSGAASGTGASTSAGPPPGNYIDAKNYGVVGDGKTDNTTALQKALDAGKASGQQVYLGAGTYAHSGPLNLNGVKLNGAGESTVLRATNPDQSAITLTGNGASLSNVKAEVVGATGRSSQPGAAAVLVQNASNATVSNVVTQGAASNGIRLDNAKNSVIRGNLVQGSNADGIALMNGSVNSRIGNNVVYQAGDDSFSDDSYNGDARQDSGNVFDSNLALDGKYGRGFALMGSTGDTLTNNRVNGVSGVGIATGTDSASGTMNGGGDTVSGNSVVNEFDANSGNATVGTPQAVTAAMGSMPSVSAILGWAATLVDKAQYGSAYQAGTGAGANNANGIRT